MNEEIFMMIFLYEYGIIVGGLFGYFLAREEYKKWKWIKAI